MFRNRTELLKSRFDNQRDSDSTFKQPFDGVSLRSTHATLSESEVAQTVKSFPYPVF